jgi:hypothetical protein
MMIKVEMATNGTSPDRIIRQLVAYRGAAAFNSAVDLDLFTRIAHGRDSAAQLAAELGVPVHGIECLCDFLACEGYLIRQGARFALPEDVARFLDRTAPGFLAAEVESAYSPAILDRFRNLTECVRNGGPATSLKGPSCFDAAQAEALANAIELPCGVPLKVLHLEAGSGLTGITLATRYPDAVVVAADGPEALRIAQAHADKAKLSTRYQNIPGDPLKLLTGRDYDAVLLATELYHRTPAQIESLLQKSADALKTTGKLYLFDFLSDASEEFASDRTTDRLLMLLTVKRGRPYSIDDIKGMLVGCRFKDIESIRVQGTLGTLVTATPSN